MPLGTDSALGTIIHPRLHTSLPLAYPSHVTIEEAAESQADDFSIDEAWTAVPGLIDIHGILAPASANEMRLTAMTNVKITHVLDLQMYCPEITNQHRAIVTREEFDTAQTFNITGVKFDSQARSTRLELEEVSH